MTEEEAVEVARAYGAKKTALEAELEAKQAAEDYDACDAIQGQLDELSAQHDIAVGIVGMTAAEASTLLSSLGAETARLQEAIAEKMAAEEYDECDALQGQLDELSAKQETAQKLSGGAVSEGIPPAAGALPSEPVPQPAPAPTPTFDTGFDFTAAAPAPAPASAPAPAPAATEPLSLGGFDFGAPAPAAEPAFGKAEATALLNDIAALESELEECMAAENYERCTALNPQLLAVGCQLLSVLSGCDRRRGDQCGG